MAWERKTSSLSVSSSTSWAKTERKKEEILGIPMPVKTLTVTIFHILPDAKTKQKNLNL